MDKEPYNREEIERLLPSGCRLGEVVLVPERPGKDCRLPECYSFACIIGHSTICAAVSAADAPFSAERVVSEIRTAVHSAIASNLASIANLYAVFPLEIGIPYYDALSRR